MKTLFKTAILASAVLASTFASATTITIKVSDLVLSNATTVNLVSTKAKAVAAEAAFLASIAGPKAVEDFESYGNTNVNVGGTNENTKWIAAATSFNTNVGTFTLTQTGQGGVSPSNGENAANNKLMIENAATGEFGRSNLTPNDARGNWLDSNDAKEVVWSLGAPLSSTFNAFGFYLSDAADIGGMLSLTFKDSSAHINWASFVKTAGLENNGTIRYVSVYSSDSILGGTMTFADNVPYDGWGVDNITVGKVPEPGSLMLMGLGLLGLGIARRRLKA